MRFNEVWGWEGRWGGGGQQPIKQKHHEGQSAKQQPTPTHIYKLVLCLSTNDERTAFITKLS